ncbi:3'(2'),5'-bisphosphate nucleotidase CysQ [Hyphobacterium sp. CCMP332]|uniref:3'(2'),5'-bisphosphate nucleotidase CysQ n=1 Tax=Hyphobacterium sp. CCMP332 TaxID=2749086 RepID=UPI00165022C1|nr:3'(2'),5'-bisphosphate nucleotidase CysQ [Hyphobacterium sp. CCMP332]QNL17885.1 3'(2'),5'-bisphosphate nucleotidase CysQ [Hyphobacterium sp. CCMP332]
MDQPSNSIARTLALICTKAAKPAMEVYGEDFTPGQKADRSPVTEADRRAEMVILEMLNRLFPGVPVMAEEQMSNGIGCNTSGDFFLVDPIDGTKEFIKKNGEFTINIGLIHERKPVAGCVYAPALGRIYLGGESAFAADLPPGAPFDPSVLTPIATRAPPTMGLTAVMSRSHFDPETQDFVDTHNIIEKISVGSSLKFCWLAEGRADVYPRFAPTMEWDTAAGHAVLNAAGGCLATPEGGNFLYAKEESRYLNGHFVGWARRPG